MNNFPRSFNSKTDSRFFLSPVTPRLIPSQPHGGENNEIAQNKAKFDRVRAKLEQVRSQIANYKPPIELTESHNNRMYNILADYVSDYNSTPLAKHKDRIIAKYQEEASRDPQSYPQFWSEVMQIGDFRSGYSYRQWFEQNNNTRTVNIEELKKQEQALQLEYNRLSSLINQQQQNNGTGGSRNKKRVSDRWGF